jgi:hypothetical protein
MMLDDIRVESKRREVAVGEPMTDMYIRHPQARRRRDQQNDAHADSYSAHDVMISGFVGIVGKSGVLALKWGYRKPAV